LAICRKPYYSGKSQIRTITQVIQRLGPSGFRTVAMEAFLDLDIYESDVWKDQLRQIRTYSLIVAHICRIISRYTKVNGNEAFTCGLLHRIGFSIALKNFTFEKYRVEEIWQALQITHPIFGKMVVTEWGLNENIQEVIGHYGQFSISQDTNLLAATVNAAEEFAHKFKFDIKPPRRPKLNVDQMMKEQAQTAFDLLDIDEHNVKRILIDIRDVLVQGLQLNIRQ
jgi:HD-like signal output (HDOD) protein